MRAVQVGSPPRRRVQLARALAAAAPALVALGVHAWRYWPFLADDALISLRYSQRLLDGLGLTWTEGAPVEGYSNLLWVLGCALLGAFSIDLIDAARILGFLGMGGALVGIAAWERDAGLCGHTSGASAALGVGLVGGVGVWAIGGLEQPLVAGLLALAIVMARPLAEREQGARSGPAALPLALLCVTRPDGALLAALVGLGVLLARGVTRESLVVVVRLGVPSVLAVLGQLAFRLTYYGDVVPNTAHAKLALTAERLATGWSYVATAAEWSWPLLLMAAAAVLRPRRVVWLPAAPLVGWLAYVAFIGGDIFPGRRHLVPAAVCLGFVIATGMTDQLRKRPWLGVLVAVALLGGQARATLRDPENLRAMDERWEWEGEVVGRLLRTAFWREQPLVAVDPAGCVPYFSELPSLDLLGLNDRYLATHPPADFGRGWLGHELGDGAYVWSRKPDLVLLCGPRGHAAGCFRSGRELLARPDFRAAYVLVEFEGRVPNTVRSSIWVRREGRVGVQHTSDTLTVPGHLLRGDEVVAALDAAGRIGASLPPNRRAVFRLPAEVGDAWDVSVQGDGGATAVLERGRLRVQAGPLAAHVQAVQLTRR